MNNDDFEIISVYSRANAIADGVLIDVSGPAAEAGFRYPVALTDTVWQGCVRVPEGVEGQDVDGRLWDILWMLRAAIARQRGDGNRIRFTVLVRNDNRRPRPVTLTAICGPGDTAEPVITVMYPHED